MLSPSFPLFKTVLATFTAHGVLSILFTYITLFCGVFPLQEYHALDVPFDRKVIQIREIGDSREGLPRGILKMLHRMRETKCRVKPFAVWLYVPKDIGIYGF